MTYEVDAELRHTLLKTKLLPQGTRRYTEVLMLKPHRSLFNSGWF